VRHNGRKVLYVADTYVNYFDPQLGRALVEVLEHNGVAVYVPPEPIHAGMPLEQLVQREADDLAVVGVEQCRRCGLDDDRAVSQRRKQVGTEYMIPYLIFQNALYSFTNILAKWQTSIRNFTFNLYLQ